MNSELAGDRTSFEYWTLGHLARGSDVESLPKDEITIPKM